MATLEIHDLHVSVETKEGPKQILRGVDLTVASGETHATMTRSTWSEMSPKNGRASSCMIGTKSAIVVKGGRVLRDRPGRSRRSWNRGSAQNVAPAFTTKVRPGSG